MANLGNVSKSTKTYLYTIPLYAGAPDVRPATLLGYGKIEGVCVFGANPVPNTRVYCIYEPNLAVVGQTITDATGAFSFPNLYIGGSTRTYTIIAKKSGQNDRIFSGVQAYDPYA